MKSKKISKTTNIYFNQEKQKNNLIYRYDSSFYYGVTKKLIQNHLKLMKSSKVAIKIINKNYSPNYDKTNNFVETINIPIDYFEFRNFKCEILFINYNYGMLIYDLNINNFKIEDYLSIKEQIDLSQNQFDDFNNQINIGYLNLNILSENLFNVLLYILKNNSLPCGYLYLNKLPENIFYLNLNNIDLNNIKSMKIKI